MAGFPRRGCLRRVAGAPPLAGGFVFQTCGARRGWELDAKSWTLEMRRVRSPDVGDGRGDDGRQASAAAHVVHRRASGCHPFKWHFRLEASGETGEDGVAHAARIAQEHGRLQARAAWGARLMRSPTEPRTMPSAAAKVAAILARSFVGGAVERPQGRAGRIRLSAISRKTSSRWLRPKALSLLTDGLCLLSGPGSLLQRF